MTKTIFSATALAALLAGPVLAQDEDIMVSDADMDGNYTLEDIQAAYPNVTAEIYAEIDTNADGEVDQDELDAAMDTGTFERIE